MSKAKQSSYTRLTVRLPESLYEQVKADAGDKSVNAEIIARLEAPSMALRDHFAAKAIASIASPDLEVGFMARFAYAIADAMLAAREAKP